MYFKGLWFIFTNVTTTMKYFFLQYKHELTLCYIIFISSKPTKFFTGLNYWNVVIIVNGINSGFYVRTT